MPRTLPTQVFRFIASTAVIVHLAAHPAAATPQKSVPPSPSSQAQLEARVKDLEARLTAAEQKADKATMEKEYILRTQNHYEAYYKEVFSTQTHILWTIGVTVTLIGITFSVVFFVAGRFGFDIFTRRIDSALKDATTQLRTEFAERLANETSALRAVHASELKSLEDGLSNRIKEQEEDLNTRSEFQFQFMQGLAASADNRWNHALTSFRSALQIYAFDRPKHLILRETGVRATRNVFITIMNQGEEKEFEANANKELADKLYNDLEDELAQAALELPQLVPLLAERKRVSNRPVAAEPKT